MRFRIGTPAKKQHSDVVTSICYSSLSSGGQSFSGGSGSSGSNPMSGGCFITASDDGSIAYWSVEGEYIGQLGETPDFGITDMHINPAAPELIAAAGSDGTLRLYVLSKPPSGAAPLPGGASPLLLREEKKVTASSVPGAAIISVRWSHDGTAIATGGEDGTVKIWSRTGMLRSTLISAGKPVYGVRWGPDNSSLLFAHGKELTIVATAGTGVGIGGDHGGTSASGVVLAGQARSKAAALSWKAHNGVILCVDWCYSTGRIVSGGEDCRYRVWDSAGRQLFASAPFETVITSAAWSPSGNTFLIGTYNTLRLCDDAGWSHSRHLLDGSGSVFGLAWTGDGMIAGAATGAGKVMTGYLIEKSAAWSSWEVVATDSHKVLVTDAASGFSEETEYRDRVMEVAVGHGQIVVATMTQIVTYSTSILTGGMGLSGGGTSIDLRHPPMSITVGPRLFGVADALTGLSIYAYDGRHVSSPKIPGVRPEDLVGKGGIALSHDVVAVLDRMDGRTVRCFDTRSGRPVGTPFVYNAGAPGSGNAAPSTGASGSGRSGNTILSIALSQFPVGGVGDRRVTFLDSGHDLYMYSPVRPSPVKVASLVDTYGWADDSDMLAVITEGGEALTTHLFPHALFTDASLERTARLVTTRADPTSPLAGGLLGSLPTIIGFHGGRIDVKRGDGAVVTVSASTYGPMLFEATGEGRWEEAVRLCRFVRVPALWSALACMALQAKNLDVAEIALASCGAVDKLQFILHVKSIQLPEVRNAELALYRRQIDEAESYLLQATPPLLYRAIKLNVRLGRWQRALDLAISPPSQAAGSSDLVDVVIYYRHEYLKALGRRETMESYLRAAAGRMRGAGDEPVADETGAGGGDDAAAVATGLARAFKLETVKAKREAEKKKEARGGAGGGGAGAAAVKSGAGHRFDGKTDDISIAEL